MPDPLERVERAAADVRRARDEYRFALVDARASGVTLAAIARAAGVSRQAVEQLVNRPKRTARS